MVVRPPWDCTRRRAEFLQWAERVAAIAGADGPPLYARVDLVPTAVGGPWYGSSS